MTTPVTIPAGMPVGEQVAAAHASAQAEIRLLMLAAVMQAWADAPLTDVRELFTWWFGEGRDRIFTAVAFGQEMMAREATDYVEDSLTLQGYDVEVGEVDPLQFAAVASDGRDLDTLLDQVVFRAWDVVEVEGGSMAQALARAEELLQRIVNTQLADAGREADQVAIVGSDIVGALTEQEVRSYEPNMPVPGRTQTDEEFLDANEIEDPWRRRRREEALKEAKRKEPTPVGWIRMVSPGASNTGPCGRCIMLAGRWYGWNEGFERHDNCQCRHIPAPEAVAGEMTVDPRAYFDELTEAQQDELFGKAAAAAIREGADMSQVMNAQNRKGGSYTVDGRQYTREGTTRAGYYYGSTEAGRNRVRRMTPLQIYREAAGDREEARRLLRRFGYLVD